MADVATMHYSDRPGYKRQGSSLISAISEGDEAALRDEKKAERDRMETQRMLEGEAHVTSPSEVSRALQRKPAQSMLLEKPRETRRVGSSARKFREDVASSGTRGESFKVMDRLTGQTPCRYRTVSIVKA